jgi:hypothetical protein
MLPWQQHNNMARGGATRLVMQQQQKQVMSERQPRRHLRRQYKRILRLSAPILNIFLSFQPLRTGKKQANAAEISVFVAVAFHVNRFASSM